MGKHTPDLTDRREWEKYIVTLMIHIYCKGNHKVARQETGCTGQELCSECAELAQYAQERTDACPMMESKTFCSSCQVHCYKPEARAQICAVMRYAGPRMMLHHPIMAVKHLIESRKEKRRQKDKTRVQR